MNRLFASVRIVQQVPWKTGRWPLIRRALTNMGATTPLSSVAVNHAVHHNKKFSNISHNNADVKFKDHRV
jgi:hypothetical protein